MSTCDNIVVEVNENKTLRMSISTVVWALVFLLLFATIATMLSTDGTPDFRQYHFYNGFVGHHDRSAQDIIPAQMQSFFFHGLDYFYYDILTSLNDHPILINMLLSLPYAGAAFLVFMIAKGMAPADLWQRDIVCAAAAIFGLTGAAALPTLATTMSDIVPGVPALFALAAWLHLEKTNHLTSRSSFVLGLVAGISVGLKLTQLPIFLGLFAAFLGRRVLGRQGTIWEAFAFGLAGLAAFVAIDASWLWGNYRTYGDPIFPFMNNVFKSDFVAITSWADLRFMPKTQLMAIFYPAYWAFRAGHDAIELDMRDPRILIGCLSAITVIVALTARSLRHRGSPAARDDYPRAYLAIAFLVTYVVWEKTWSIYRYLADLECLCGVMLLMALVTLVGTRARPRFVPIMFAVVVSVAMVTTQYPWWPRATPGAQAMTIDLPPIEPNAMVVFLDGYAYSYLVPFMPSSVRAIGAASNLGGPGSPGRLQHSIEAAIRDHPGPLWGMEYTYFEGAADATLNSYRLRRGSCTVLHANVDEDRDYVRICRLGRT